MTMTATKKTFREARLLKGYSQDELARLTGVRQQQISHIEMGRRNPSLTLALKLAALLEVDVNDLFF